MDYEIRVITYLNRFNAMSELHDMMLRHTAQKDTPLNRLALKMSRHHLERCFNNPDNRS